MKGLETHWKLEIGLFGPGFLEQIAQFVEELVVRLPELEAIEPVPRVRGQLDRRDLGFLRGQVAPRRILLFL